MKRGDTVRLMAVASRQTSDDKGTVLRGLTMSPMTLAQARFFAGVTSERAENAIAELRARGTVTNVGTGVGGVEVWGLVT